MGLGYDIQYGDCGLGCELRARFLGICTQRYFTQRNTGSLVLYIKIVTCVPACVCACVRACVTFWIAYCMNTTYFMQRRQILSCGNLRWEMYCIRNVLYQDPLRQTDRRLHVITCTIARHLFNISAEKIDGVEKRGNTAPILGRLLGNRGSQRYADSPIRRRREWPLLWCVVCSCARSTCNVAMPIVRK